MSITANVQSGVRDGIVQGIDGSIFGGQPFPRTAADLARYVGATPTNIFRHDQASGNSVDDLAGVTLSPQSGITVGVLTNFGGADRGITAADNTMQHMQAAFSSVFDVQTESFAFLHVVNFGGTPPAATRNWIGKIGGSFYTGRVDGSTLSFVVFDGTLSRTASITMSVFDSDWHCVIAGVDFTSEEVVLAMDGQTTARTSTAGLATLTNLGSFTIGRSSVSAPQTFTYTARFIGVNAEALLADPSTAIAAFFEGP